MWLGRALVVVVVFGFLGKGACTITIDTGVSNFSRSSAPSYQKELGVSRQWFDRTFASDDATATCPITFNFAGQSSGTLLSKWHSKVAEEKLGGQLNRIITYRDSHTGLELRLEIKRYLDYPAIEWGA